MNRKSALPGLTMAQRVALGSESEPCPARHCWVSGGIDDAGTKRPGLLVEWRWAAAGWEGRVVYVAAARSSGWLLVEEWLPASLLTPR
jgi:hypothetical protein